MGYYALTAAEYDGLTLEFLNVLVAQMNHSRER